MEVEFPKGWNSSPEREGRINPMEPQFSMTPNDPVFYKELLNHVSDGVYFVDRDRKILYWSEGAFRLTGYKAEELTSRCCQDDILCHVDDTGKRLCLDGCPLTASIDDGNPHEANVFLRHKQGRRVPVSVLVHPIRGADGAIVGAMEIFRDNSAELEAHRKIEAMNRLAFLDHLTQLPNRRFLEMSTQTALAEYSVHGDPFGILVIDVDRFKTVNDSFGHAGGDLTLQEVAKTLAGVLRPTDIVGRWGGDEFVAIVRNVTSEVLVKLADRCVVLVARTSIPCDDGRRISPTVSVGAAIVRPGDTPEILIQRADERMYQSKTNGRNRGTAD